MKVVILHNKVSEGASKDEEDVLVQVEAVFAALAALGHRPVAVPFSIDAAAAMQAVRAIAPDLVFNLVESVEGAGRLIHLAPALLDHMRIPYTGAGTEAIFLTSNKLVAKEWLKKSGLPTPAWIAPRGGRGAETSAGGPFIVKSVWEHASVGLDEDSVIFADSDDPDRLIREMERRKDSLGGDCFAEAFIDGREFNLSLLAGPDGPEVLPPAEIRFDLYPPDKPKVVGYRAKWESDSFEYLHTERTFEFSPADEPLVARLGDLARQCWDIFHLRGYARVDFRVDKSGAPWVLEVNANPCLSQDAGFYAAAQRAGLGCPEVIGRIIAGSVSVGAWSADV
jgi:D-alanine-D-alanine ligase